MLLQETEPHSREDIGPVSPAVVSARTTTRAATAAAISAIGLAGVAAGYYMERSGVPSGSAHLAFWAGLATLIFPLALVQLSTDLPRGHRIALVILGGLLFYAVKVLHDPALFTNSDEFTHLAAAQQLHDSRHLYEPLPIGGVTVANGFPGLHIVTVALSDLSGLTLHTSGLLVIAAARVIFVLVVFLIAERLTKSPMTAGLAAIFTAANGNFIFWSSQFSYESLSLPLFLVAIYLAANRNAFARQRGTATIAAAVITLAVIATHHLTSYALAASLWALCALSLRRRWRHLRCVDLAVLATAGAALWFALVAGSTGAYLSYVFNRTYSAISDVSGNGTHVPFQDQSGLQTPVGERLLGFLAAGIISLAVLWGLWVLWRRRDRFALATRLLLTVCGLAFLSLFPLKVFPGAWETVNRSSNFTSIGAAVIVASAIAAMVVRRQTGRIASTLIAGVITLAICGAAIQGWPSRVLLSQPLEIQSGSAVLRPEGFSASAWATSRLPASSVYVADEVTGRELAVDRAGFTLSGRADGVREVLSRPGMEPWQRDLLRKQNVDFAVLDRRRISANNVTGYFFQPANSPDGGAGYYTPRARAKFAALPRSSRVFDSGNIVIYDIRGLRGRPADCRDLPSIYMPNERVCRTGTRTTMFANTAQTVDYGSGFRLSLVDAYVERRTSSTVVELSLQANNSGPAPVRVDMHRAALHVGGASVDPSGPSGDGTFGSASGKAKVRTQKFGKLRFRLRGRVARKFARSGGYLTVASPTDPRVRARYDFDSKGKPR